MVEQAAEVEAAHRKPGGATSARQGADNDAAVEQHEQPLRIFDDAVAAQQPGARGTPASVGSSHRPEGMPTLNVGKISESDKLNAPGTVDRLLSVLR